MSALNGASIALEPSLRHLLPSIQQGHGRARGVCFEEYNFGRPHHSLRGALPQEERSMISFQRAGPPYSGTASSENLPAPAKTGGSGERPGVCAIPERAILRDGIDPQIAKGPEFAPLRPTQFPRATLALASDELPLGFEEAVHGAARAQDDPGGEGAHPAPPRSSPAPPRARSFGTSPPPPTASALPDRRGQIPAARSDPPPSSPPAPTPDPAPSATAGLLNRANDHQTCEA